MKSVCYVIFFISLLRVTQSFEYEAFTKNKMSLDGWYTSYQDHRDSHIDTFKCVNEVYLGFKSVRQTLFTQFELPPHHKIQISVKTWKIYTYEKNVDIPWPTGEIVIGYLDDIQFDNLVSVKNSVSRQSGQGRCKPDDKQSEEYHVSHNMQFEFTHRAKTAFVIFTTNTYNEQKTKYWGISDFKLTISECPKDCSYCIDSNECSSWQLIAQTLLETAEFKVQGWESPIKKVVKCQSLIFFGVGAFDTKTNEKEVKTFKFGKVKPHFQFKIMFLFAVLDFQKKNLQLQVRGKDSLLYEEWIKEQHSYQHDLCDKNKDIFQIFYREYVTLSTEFLEQLSEQITFQVKYGNTDLAPFVWGIRDVQLFVQYCPENCLKCRDSTSCIDCDHDYIWDYYKQICVQNDFEYIQNIRQFNANQFSEIDGWTLKNNNQGIQVGTCSVSLVGGLNILGSFGRAARKFALKKHDRVRIILNIYLFGNWEDQSIYIEVDGTIQKTIKVAPNQLKQKACNSDQLIKIGILKQVVVDQPHLKDFILVDIYAQIDDYKNEATWGFRDFSLQTFQKFSCAKLFTQIDYKGEETQVCQQGDEKILISTDVQSIKVPQNSRITLTTDSEEEITILADTPSLDNKKVLPIFNYQFTLAQFSMIEQQDQNDQNNAIIEAVEQVVETVQTVDSVEALEAVEAIDEAIKAVE